jgi:hypothetical protein
MAKKFICVGEPYESNGEEKMSFKRIGELFTGKNGKEYAKLYTIPGQLLHVFEDKPKEPQPTGEEF